ncbi:unnamed protein product, partial [Amoebophrya sp. A120]
STPAGGKLRDFIGPERQQELEAPVEVSAEGKQAEGGPREAVPETPGFVLRQRQRGGLRAVSWRVGRAG